MCWHSRCPAGGRRLFSFYLSAGLLQAVHRLFLSFPIKRSEYMAAVITLFSVMEIWSFFSDSLWWWVKRLFLLRGEEVFKLVWFLVNSKAYRDPKEMPDISLKMTFLLVFWRSGLSMFTGQDLVLWILKVFKMFDLHFNWILWHLVKKKK